MENASPSPPPSTGEISGGHTVDISQNSNKGTVISSIDEVVERYMSATVGNLLFPFLACFTLIFDSQQTFINVFSDKPPPWHCISSTCDFSRPCNLPSNSSWSYSQPRKISTVSDFSLECSSPIRLALPASSFYAGCLVGGLSLATLADSRLGRKNALVLSTLIMSLAAALTALSPNLAVYAALRFTCGFGRANVGTSAYVLSIELVSRRQRKHVNIITFIFSTTGFLTLPVIAFLNRANSWRLLYVYTSIPSLFYCIFLHFFMKESPRWLLLKDKREEAIETLKKLSSLEETESFSDLAMTYSEKTKSGGLYSVARILWEKPWALQRLLVILIVSFGIGLMYYGMPLNLGNINANLYISAALNAVAELPSAFIIFFLANVISRRRTLVWLTIVSGGCSLACTAMGGWPAVVFELVAFFGACTTFYIEIIYAVELFPTCVRNSAMAVQRQAVVLGGVAAPAMVALGRRRKFLSFGMFGIVIIFCGLFIMFLPETRGRAISDTMEEEESRMKEGETTGDHTVDVSQNSNKGTVISSIDEVVERYMSATVGNLLFPFLACFTLIFDSQQTFINVFSDKPPPWHCTSSACDFSRPCNLPSNSSWSYTQPRKISTVSDFSLECSSPILLALPASSFYAGCLVGGLSLATLADSRLGRKNALVLSTLIMSLAAALTALSPNLAVYAALRFTCGFGRANVGTSAYVLSTELVSRRQRKHVNIITFIFSTTGFLTLPVIAFLNRANSWRLLYVYTSIPSLFYCIFLHFFMKESPRWLLLKDKREEAIETLKKLSSLEETESFSDLAMTYSEKTKSGGLYSVARILWEKPWALQRLLVILIVSFGIGLMYYGMPLNLGNINANLYISAALNAVAELPSAFIIFFLANVISRRRTLVWLTIVSGGCSLACTAMGGWPAVVFELVAFFGACTAFYIEIIYAVELFPTCVRNSAMAVQRQAVVLGGVAAPAMVALGRRRKFLSFGMFGILIIFCGLFIMFLPETRGRAISDTMEEEESRMKEGKIFNNSSL
ncbi:hypothetical protein M5K25_002130 [Dendrobium thyrsiflorum]|uniref:H(+)/Pi cotransporter n=1 Tax=Dendrobium thyrsiflorum TaxID=117978 RepID=A0ABD0W4F7_DENTH